MNSHFSLKDWLKIKSFLIRDTRQFTQCDIDTIGSTIKDEAEILGLADEIWKKLGIKPLILINNRKLLNEILEDNGIKKNKEQTLREIDKYNKLSEQEIKNNLSKLGAAKILNIIVNYTD